MTKTIKKENYIEKSKKSLLWPIIFFVIIIASTVALFFYNNVLKGQISDLDEQNQKMAQTIQELNSNPEVKVYKLLDNNKAVIEQFDKRSQIVTYIKHIKSLNAASTWKRYWVLLQGFSLSNWNINSTAMIESESTSLAYEITQNFIAKYRLDPESILELNFINQIEWMDTIKFNTNFTIK